MNRQTVVHLTSVHAQYDPRIRLKECTTLRAAGYDVVLVASGGADRVEDGIRVRTVPKPGGRVERFLRTTVQVARAAWREQPALVHLHDPELLPVGQVLRILGIPVIFDMHENVPASLRTKEWIPRALRPTMARAYRAVERMLLFRIPVVFAESSYEAEYAWIGATTTVLNFPLLEELFRTPRSMPSGPTVGYMGLVSSQRGAIVTARALARLREEGMTVRWECVGPTAPGCAEQIKTLAGEQVRLHGPLPPRSGWEIMAGCTVGLAVLSPVPNYMDSYPTKMFEYMALGLPVIGSNFQLYREVIESTGCGLCVDPDDPDALAAAVRWLIEHPEEARAMGERGRAAVRTQYNWESQAPKLLEFYERVLKREVPVAAMA